MAIAPQNLGSLGVLNSCHMVEPPDLPRCEDAQATIRFHATAPRHSLISRYEALVITAGTDPAISC